MAMDHTLYFYIQPSLLRYLPRSHNAESIRAALLVGFFSQRAQDFSMLVLASLTASRCSFAGVLCCGKLTGWLDWSDVVHTFDMGVACARCRAARRSSSLTTSRPADFVLRKLGQCACRDSHTQRHARYGSESRNFCGVDVADGLRVDSFTMRDLPFKFSSTCSTQP